MARKSDKTLRFTDILSFGWFAKFC